MMVAAMLIVEIDIIGYFYPDEYLDSTYDIDFEKLYEEGIRGIIFDIDNEHGSDHHDASGYHLGSHDLPEYEIRSDRTEHRFHTHDDSCRCRRCISLADDLKPESEYRSKYYKEQYPRDRLACEHRSRHRPVSKRGYRKRDYPGEQKFPYRKQYRIIISGKPCYEYDLDRVYEAADERQPVPELDRKPLGK